MTEPSTTTQTREQWLVDGATVYKLHIPHDPRYEHGQPCPENRLSFHVQQGRGVKREEAEQMARYIAHLLNSAPSDTEQRLREALEPHKKINFLTALEHQAHRNHEYRPGHCAECSLAQTIAERLREEFGLTK